jgi:hypothetical protein
VPIAKRPIGGGPEEGGSAKFEETNLFERGVGYCSVETILRAGMCVCILSMGVCGCHGL